MAERRALLPAGYSRLLSDLKQRIQAAQLRASLAVNRELVILYWQIGRDILARQERESWGAKIIDRLAADLKAAFPAMKGFSPRNLKYMRAFAEAWPEEVIVQQLVAQIPWGNNVRILDHLKDPAEREWYVRATLQHGWRAVTFSCIRSKAGLSGGRARRSRILSGLCHCLNRTLPNKSQKIHTTSTFCFSVRTHMREISNLPSLSTYGNS